MNLSHDMFSESGRVYEGRKPIPILILKEEYEAAVIAYVYTDSAMREAFEGKPLDEQIGMSEIVIRELSYGEKAADPTRAEMEAAWGESENYFAAEAILVSASGLYLGVIRDGVIAVLGRAVSYRATSRMGDDNNGAGYKEGRTYTATFELALHYSPSVWDTTTFYRNRAHRALSEITIPESIEKIGQKAFYGCDRLARITLPKGLKVIGAQAFDHCSALCEIDLPEGLTEIGYAAFSCCTALKAITLPQSLTKLGSRAFMACSSLTEFALPSHFTGVPDALLQRCESLVRVDLPKGILRIGMYAFYECTALAEIALPEGLTEIESDAFKKCTALNGLVIPKSVKTIGWSALWGPKNTVYLNK